MKTIPGETRGGTVSGGQRAAGFFHARCAVKKCAPILIWMIRVSAVDTRTEKNILDNLKTTAVAGKTTLLTRTSHLDSGGDGIRSEISGRMAE